MKNYKWTIEWKLQFALILKIFNCFKKIFYKNLKKFLMEILK